MENGGLVPEFTRVGPVAMPPGGINPLIAGGLVPLEGDTYAPPTRNVAIPRLPHSLVHRIHCRPDYPAPTTGYGRADPTYAGGWRGFKGVRPLSPVHTNHRRQDLTEHFRFNSLVVWWRPTASEAVLDPDKAVFARISELFTRINPASHTVRTAMHSGNTEGLLDARLVSRWTVHDDPPRLCPSCGDPVQFACCNSPPTCGAFTCAARQQADLDDRACGCTFPNTGPENCTCSQTIMRHANAEHDDDRVSRRNLWQVLCNRDGPLGHNRKLHALDGVLFTGLAVSFIGSELYLDGIAMPDYRRHAAPFLIRVSMRDAVCAYAEVPEFSHMRDDMTNTHFALASIGLMLACYRHHTLLREKHREILTSPDVWCSLYADQVMYGNYIAPDNAEEQYRHATSARILTLVSHGNMIPRAGLCGVPLRFRSAARGTFEATSEEGHSPTMGQTPLCSCAKASPFTPCTAENHDVNDGFCNDCAATDCHHMCLCVCALDNFRSCFASVEPTEPWWSNRHSVHVTVPINRSKLGLLNELDSTMLCGNCPLETELDGEQRRSIGKSLAFRHELGLARRKELQRMRSDGFDLASHDQLVDAADEEDDDGGLTYQAPPSPPASPPAPLAQLPLDPSQESGFAARLARIWQKLCHMLWGNTSPDSWLPHATASHVLSMSLAAAGPDVWGKDIRFFIEMSSWLLRRLTTNSPSSDLLLATAFSRINRTGRSIFGASTLGVMVRSQRVRAIADANRPRDAEQGTTHQMHTVLELVLDHLQSRSHMVRYAVLRSLCLLGTDGRNLAAFNERDRQSNLARAEALYYATPSWIWSSFGRRMIQHRRRLRARLLARGGAVPWMDISHFHSVVDWDSWTWNEPFPGSPVPFYMHSSADTGATQLTTEPLPPSPPTSPPPTERTDPSRERGHAASLARKWQKLCHMLWGNTTSNPTSVQVQIAVVIRFWPETKLNFLPPGRPYPDHTLPYILIMRHDATTWHVYRALERDIVQSILHTDTRPDEFFLWQNVEIVRRLYALSLCELKGATHPLPRADLALSEHVDLERINLHRNGFRAIELNLKLRSPHCSSADLFMPRGCLTIKQPLGREVHDRHTPSDAASNHFFDHNTTCFEISSASAVVSASTAKHRIEGRAAEILRFLFPHAYLHERDTMQIASSTAKTTLDAYAGNGQLGAFQGPQGYLALAIRAAETFMETYYEMARHKFQHAPYRSSAHAGDPTWVDALPEQSAAVMLRTPGVHEYIAIEAAHYALRFLPLRMITANEVAEVALPYALEWSLTLADITWYTTAWDDPIAPRLPQHLRSDLADQLQRRQVLSPEDHWTNLLELSGLESYLEASAPDRILRAIEEAYDEADVSASTHIKSSQTNREIGFYQARTIMLLGQDTRTPPSAPPSPPPPDDLRLSRTTADDSALEHGYSAALAKVWASLMHALHGNSLLFTAPRPEANDAALEHGYSAALARVWASLMHALHGNSVLFPAARETPKPQPESRETTALFPAETGPRGTDPRPHAAVTPVRASFPATPDDRAALPNASSPTLIDTPRLFPAPSSPTAQAQPVLERSSPAVLFAMSTSTAEQLPPIELTSPARPSSPQPTSACMAREWASTRISQELAADTSAYTLAHVQPQRLETLVKRVSTLRDAGIPPSTKTSDETGFKQVMECCKRLSKDLRWMRPRAVVTAFEIMREVWFAILIIVQMAQFIKPSKKREKQGYLQGKPSSVLNNFYAYRRVQFDCSRHLCDLKHVGRLLKGLSAEYVQTWGEDALIVDNAQPMSRSMTLAMANALAQGKCEFSDKHKTMWQALHAYELSTGERKNGIGEAFPGDTFVRRSDLVWVHDTTFAPLPKSQQTVRSRSSGCLLRGRAPAAKADRFKVDWGGRFEWFEYDSSDPLNFAHAYQQYQLACPCPADQEDKWPAFGIDGGPRPCTTRRLHDDFKHLVGASLPSVDAADTTFHDYRATVASALCVARELGRVDITDGTIQAIERWKTVESVQRYQHMSPRVYASYVRLATDTDAGRSAHVNAPETGAAGAAYELQAISNELLTNKKRTHLESFTIDNVVVQALGDDSWNLVGTEVSVHNSLWQDNATGSTKCLIVAYIGRHDSGSGPRQSYVLQASDDDEYYIAEAKRLKSALPSSKRSKLTGEPKLLK